MKIICRIAIFVCFAFFLCSLLVTFEKRRYEKRLNKLIYVKNENIAFIRVLHDSGTWSPKLTVFCMFKDNDWMILSNVRERNGDNIILLRYNGFVFYDCETEKIISLSSRLFAEKLGITLETFSDFIKNKFVLAHFFEVYKDGEVFFLKQENGIPIKLKKIILSRLKFIQLFHKNFFVNYAS